MQTRNWEDFIEFDVDGRAINREGKLNVEAVNQASVSLTLSEISATPTKIPGNLDGTEDGDLIAVELVAGQTYSFDFRGVAGGLSDPYLFLLRSDLSTIAGDDDGGAGTSSQITYRPTVSGTYYLYATSYEAAAGGTPSADFGDYTINMWSPEADVPGSTDVVASLATAVTIGTGTTFGNLDVVRDNDYYAVEVKAGMVYSFGYSGGVSGAADRNGEFGENLATLSVYNAAGTQLSTNFNYESGTSYYAANDATIYLRVAGSTEPALGGTGGYTLDVTAIDPSTRDPLESLNWDRADNIDTVLVGGVATAYVYFAPAGENFGEKADNGTSPMVTYGWTDAQKAAVMSALGEYTPITGINYVVTTDVNQAEFRMLTTNSTLYGARFYPQDPSYGTQQGIGTFNLASGGFGSDPNSLLPGGYSYAVILHEFGHAHGIAHPHDTGGGSEVMLGVTGATGSLGVYDLNQGVYTVMSYNDGWVTDPDGVRAYSAANRSAGWSETLGAFDIAVLQARYGVHASAVGDNVYNIADVQADSQYRTIWDTGGNDTIAYTGTRDAQIDLLAATLDYTPTGGGVVSFAHGVWGGFTIANGVVVENATGGSGNDVLLGNAANNVITGNAGNDTLVGRAGNDTLNGGAGNDGLNGGDGVDTATYAGATAGVTVNLSLSGAQVTGGAGTDTLTSIENLIGSGFNDRLIGNGGANTIKGGNGLDVVTLGGGNDTFVAEVGAAKVALKTGLMSVDIITDFDAFGDDFIDLSGLGVGFNFRGTDANKNAGDLSYKTYDSINGAEKALGFDIDGNPGAGGVGGPVTVVYGNTDGGSVDFAIVLLNTRSVDANDFLFSSTASVQEAHYSSFGLHNSIDILS